MFLRDGTSVKENVMCDILDRLCFLLADEFFSFSTDALLNMSSS